MQDPRDNRAATCGWSLAQTRGFPVPAPHSLPALRRTLLTLALGTSVLIPAQLVFAPSAQADTTPSAAVSAVTAEQPAPTLSIAASRTELTLGSYVLTVTGTLLDVDGQPRAGQRVSLLEQSWRGQRLVKQAVTDVDGRVQLTFSGYTADYRLLATDGDTGREITSQSVHVSLVVETGIYPDDMDLLGGWGAEDYNHVRGTVAARFGPVPEATVELWQRKDDDSWVMLARGITDERGRYDMTVDPSLSGEAEVRYEGGVWQYFTTTPASAEQHIPTASTPASP
jgi:5-hydroxyisourate hydrolase-like protein (transthyretin family)